MTSLPRRPGGALAGRLTDPGGIAGDGEDEADRAYREGYERIPFGTPDEWGDVGAFHAALAELRHGSRGASEQ